MGVKVKKYNNPRDEALRIKLAPENANIPKSHLFRMQVLRQSQDVATWRECANVAERAYFPSRVNMQRMFADTRLNGHVDACYNKRKNLLLQREFFVGVGKTENEELTKMFNSQWFSDVLGYIFDAKMYGYSMINWTGWDYNRNKMLGLKLVPRENIMVDLGGLFTDVDGGVNRIPSNVTPPLKFTDEEIQSWSMVVTTPNEQSRSSCGLGLLYPVSLYAIFMQQNLGYNADFVEKFMMPIVVGKTQKSDITERKEMLNDLQTFGSSAAIVLDMLDEIEFIEAKNTGTAYNSFDNFEKRLMALISKMMLGHADALDSTPGKLGNNDNALDALEEVGLVDCKFVQSVIVDVFFDKLRLLGYDIPFETEFYYTNNHEELEEQKQRAEFNGQTATWIKSLSDAGYEVDEAEVSELIGFTVKKKAEPVVNTPKLPKDVQNKLNLLYEID